MNTAPAIGNENKNENERTKDNEIRTLTITGRRAWFNLRASNVSVRTSCTETACRGPCPCDPTTEGRRKAE